MEGGQREYWLCEIFGNDWGKQSVLEDNKIMDEKIKYPNKK